MISKKSPKKKAVACSVFFSIENKLDFRYLRISNETHVCVRLYVRRFFVVASPLSLAFTCLRMNIRFFWAGFSGSFSAIICCCCGGGGGGGGDVCCCGTGCCCSCYKQRKIQKFSYRLSK